MGQNQWYHFGVGAPTILEPILVGIGMFIDPWPFDTLSGLRSDDTRKATWQEICGHLDDLQKRYSEEPALWVSFLGLFG